MRNEDFVLFTSLSPELLCHCCVSERALSGRISGFVRVDELFSCSINEIGAVSDRGERDDDGKFG